MKGVVRMEASHLYLAKRGCEEITSSFVATKANLIPSFSLTHALDGVASVVSFLPLTKNTLLTCLPGERTARLSSSDTTISKLPKNERECPDRGYSESVSKPRHSKYFVTTSP